ncbi:MAG TPA: hypothetical protein VIX19_17360, partial [Terriglobales bacterium]
SIITTATLCPTSAGCKLFFPPGSYLVEGGGLSIPQGQPFVYFLGAGASNSTILAAGSPVTNPLTAGTSEIVTADRTYALTVGSAGGSSFNGGPRISNIAFRDVSGVGNAYGGIHFESISHAFLDNLAFIDFANGAGAFFDAGGATSYNQYNFIVGTTAVNVRTPFQFSTGQNASNWIIGGNLVGSQVGGGACIDFQGNFQSSPSPSSGGHNYLFYPQCNYFPVAVHLYDQNSDPIFVHAEQTAANATNVIGSAPSGTGMIVDGTSGTTNCIDNQISLSTFTSFSTGISVTSNCTHTVITSPAYSNITAHLSDSGVNTQTAGAPPDAQNIAFAGPGSSMVQYYAAVSGTGVTANQLVCFSTTVNFGVKNCATSATNFTGVAMVTPTSGSPIPIQVAGIATISLDNSGGAVVTGGDYICSGNSGKGHENSTSTCSPGQQVGIAAAGSGTSMVSSASVFLQKD